MKTARYIKTDGEETLISPKNGKDFSLHELYKLLDTDMIEAVPLHKSGKLLICDEEGMSNNKPVNQAATIAIAMENIILPPEGMLGHVIICDHDMLK